MVCTKYRHPVLVDGIKDRLIQISYAIIENSWKSEILEINTDTDHVHILFETSPQTQLSKLIDVIKIVNLSKVESIERELVMIKVKAGRENRADIINIVEIFRAKIVDVGPEDVVVELTGSQSKIDGIIEVLSEYEILEIARTGAIALSRGPVPVKRM